MSLAPAIGIILAAVAVASHAAPARPGKSVVETFCVECHGSGRDGAPRLGDAKAWAPRAARGLKSLTDSALAGVRKMPPHGGTLQISDLELKRAIAYMVNQSGGRWAEPTDRGAQASLREGEDIVQSQCTKCHARGEGGAPRIGDREAWVGRARLGLDSLVQSAIHGHGGMPARGGMADLTDSEMRAAIIYMFQKSASAPPKPR